MVHMGRATLDELHGPTSLRTDDEINIFHQCAQLGGKYIVSTTLLCDECISHIYKFVTTWLMVVTRGFQDRTLSYALKWLIKAYF